MSETAAKDDAAGGSRADSGKPPGPAATRRSFISPLSWAFLIVSGVGLAALLLAALSRPAYTGVWVAREDLPAYRIIRDNDVELAARPASGHQAYASQVDGGLVLRAIRAGDPLRKEDVAPRGADRLGPSPVAVPVGPPPASIPTAVLAPGVFVELTVSDGEGRSTSFPGVVLTVSRSGARDVGDAELVVALAEDKARRYERLATIGRIIVTRDLVPDGP